MFRSGNFLWQRKFEKVPVKKQIFGNKCILKIVKIAFGKVFIINFYRKYL